MEWLRMARWSPYAVGIAIGILSWFTFLLSNKTIGCSTAFSRTAGMIERLFRGDKVLRNPYYQKTAPKIEWGWMLVAGAVIGGFVSAQLSGQFEFQWVPALWVEAFGRAPLPRQIVAFLGGILMGLGSRWAGGCTSGHGISGTLQLVVGSWLASICIFVGGIVTALLIFGLWAR
jgi:uncharacterized membrane protein YedE/YeeE